MILTHKERLLPGLRHQPVDRLPTQINYTAGMGRLLAAHYGVSAGELPAVLDNHLVRVDVDHPEPAQRGWPGPLRLVGRGP